MLNKGDEVEVKVVEVDRERGRIGLRLADDPEIQGKNKEELAPSPPPRPAVHGLTAGRAIVTAGHVTVTAGRATATEADHATVIAIVAVCAIGTPSAPAPSSTRRSCRSSTA